MDFNYRIENKGDWDIIYFAGDINEDAEVALGGMKDKIAGPSIFNLRDIRSINSCGVRAWINFIREAQKKGDIVYVECPPEVVSQMNMIPNFKGNARIQSVYASYTCENCDTHKLELFEEGRNLPRAVGDKLPKVSCPKCQETMEMEELEEEFFGWLDIG